MKPWVVLANENTPSWWPPMTPEHRRTGGRRAPEDGEDQSNHNALIFGGQFGAYTVI